MGDGRILLSARDEAIQSIEAALESNLDELIASHREWWHAYYPASFVTLPHARAESYYWIQIYKMGCAGRRGRPAIDNLGPWSTETNYPHFWWNLNAQLIYWPQFATNHLEYGEPFLEMLDRSITISPTRSQDYAAVKHVSSFVWDTAEGDSCHLVWCCHNYWLHYRHSMDESLLPRLFSLLRLCVNGMTRPENMVEGDDGRLHLVDCRSPEYSMETPLDDSNYELALLRWGCETLLWLVDRLDIDDALRARWADVLDRLAEYPVDETGLRISADMGIDKGHRHYSHLLMYYPLRLRGPENPDERELLERSIETWLSAPEDEKGRTAYTWTGAASFEALLGNGNTAWNHLEHYLNADSRGYRIVQPNTFYRELGQVFESPVSWVVSINELLVQSWAGRIQVFPAVPGEWPDMTFHSLRTEGAFLVSACRQGGRTKWVHVASEAGEPCVIEPGLVGEVKAEGATVKRVSGGVYELAIREGESALLYAGDQPPEAAIEPLPRAEGDENPYPELP